MRKLRMSLSAVLTFFMTAAVLVGCGSASGQSADGSDVITIGSVGPVTGPDMHIPQARSAIKAAISAINASGGVNGHQLRLDYCDTKFDPNEAASCARQLVSDHVSAVVGPSLLFYPDSSLTVMEKAGIPIIASQGITVREFQSPVAFPLAGVPGWFYGAVAMLVERGATNISVIGIDNAASSFSNHTVLRAIKAAGLPPAHNIAVAPNTVDLAPAAHRAIAGDVDGVVITTSPQVASKSVAALRAAGYDGLIAGVTESLPQESVTALGAKAEGMLLTSLAALPDDPSNPSARQFRADMEKYQPATKELDSLAFEGWAATMLFAKVASRSSHYDADAILRAMKNLKPVHIPAYGGFATKNVKSPIAKLPQLLHTKIQGAVVKDGKITAAGDLFDPFKMLAEYNDSH